jgi:DNA polymerase-3 subunit delta
MKLQFRQIEPFLKSPDPSVRAIIVYGPDGGLVRERAKTLGQQVVPDLSDPFNVSHLTGDIVAADPARFLDEANARSLMGGRRLVRITDPGEGIAQPLKDWLKTNPGPDTLIVIEAGDLKPKSALRKLAEDAKNAAALPCYIEDERSLAGFIRDTVREAGFTIQNDALTWLAANIRGDRQRARMEIEKLILYCGGYASENAAQTPQHKKPITLEDAQESSGEAGAQSLDDLVYAVFSGQPGSSAEAFRRLLGEGVEPIVMLRSLQNHLLRLHLVRTQIDLHGISLEEAMKNLNPPIFFKQADQFRAQAGRFSAPQIRNMIRRISLLESRTKQTGVPVETLCAQTFLNLARAA